MAYEEMKLEGLFRTVGKPYGRWKKLRKQDQVKDKEKEGKIFIPAKFQPLFRITEQNVGGGRVWISAKFARNVPVEEWERFPRYEKHTINHLS